MTSTAPHPHDDIIIAADIAPIDRDEAYDVAMFELQQVLNLLETLDADDWSQPTECTAWAVQDMVAHLAGACAGWAVPGQFLRQVVFNPHKRAHDALVDAINQRQVEDRADKSSADLMAELREVGPRAMARRRGLPGLVRRVQISQAPLPGKMAMGYLVDVIYPRDQWMHRMDISEASGKPFVYNADHDRRMLDLVMRDLAAKLDPAPAVTVNVVGGIELAYRFGQGPNQAEIDIDFIDLNRRASGRITPADTLEKVNIRGDRALAHAFIDQCEVLY